MTEDGAPTVMFEQGDPYMSEQSDTAARYGNTLFRHAPLNEWADTAIAPGTEVVGYEIDHAPDTDERSEPLLVLRVRFFTGGEYYVRGATQEPGEITFTGDQAADQITEIIDMLLLRVL